MKRPWNRVDLPIYSISSCHEKESNMHICTYVSAVSMEPKRMMVAIYKDTKTIELVNKNPHFVLQLLSKSQYNLIKLLGQNTGHKIDKITRLQKRGLLSVWKEFNVLKEALAFMELNTIETLDAGDHVMHLCEMVSFSNNLDGDPLTLKVLRDKKIIRG